MSSPTSSLRFAGKVTLRSTNASGERRYWTPGTKDGVTFPWMKAPQPTGRERVILYLGDDGQLRIAMDDQSYITLKPQLGWVIGTRAPKEAQPLRWAAAGAGGAPSSAPGDEPSGEGGLEIWDPVAAEFKRVRYSVDTPLPYLVVDLDGAAAEARALASGVPARSLDAPTTLTTFTRTQVTPGLEAIRRAKAAPGADLRKVDLTGADLSGLDLTGADFTGAILDRAKLNGAQLPEAVFAGASLLGTDLSGTTLDGADFAECDLSKAIFDHLVKARGTDFTGCVLVGVSMAAPAGSPGADLSGAILVGAELPFANLTGAVLHSARMQRANLTGAVLGRVDFTGAQLGGLDKSLAASLPYSYLANAVFSQANLFGVSFAFATLFGASVRITDTSTLEQADFTNAYLAGIDLSGAVLSGSRFDGACLVNVSFVGAVLTATLKGSIRTSLAGAVLYGAEFQGAKLDGADFSGAAVAFGKGFLPVRYCGANGKPFPFPPDDQPTAHRETTGIDRTTLGSGTICPNGLQWGKRGSRSLVEMLTVANPPDAWYPRACRPADPLPEPRGRRPRLGDGGRNQLGPTAA